MLPSGQNRIVNLLWVDCAFQLFSRTCLKVGTGFWVTAIPMLILRLIVFCLFYCSRVLRRRRRGSTFKQQLHKKCITSAGSSAVGATPAAQVSGETFLSLYRKHMHCKNIEKHSNLLASLSDATSLPSHISLLLQPMLDGSKHKHCKRHSTLRETQVRRLKGGVGPLGFRVKFFFSF